VVPERHVTISCSNSVSLCFPIADITEGILFHVEMVDWTGGQVRDDYSADDIKFLDLTIVTRRFSLCKSFCLMFFLLQHCH